MTRLASVCPECGAVFERDRESAYCDECRPPDTRDLPNRRGTTAEQGYGARWQRLSKRARRLQPFCSDCGSPDDLTGDHTQEAWRRYYAGKSIRLQDIDVVCRTCNSERGEARGEVSERRLIVDKELADRRKEFERDEDLFLDD